MKVRLRHTVIAVAIIVVTGAIFAVYFSTQGPWQVTIATATRGGYLLPVG